MWTLLFERESDFNLIRDLLKKELSTAHVQLMSSGGLPALEAPEGSKLPNCILLDLDPLKIAHTLQWAHKTWSCSDFVSTQILRSINEQNQGLDNPMPFCLPDSCLRSAGHTDLAGGPILYEEMAFSEMLQNRLRKAFDRLRKQMLDPHKSLFSGLGITHDENFEKTLINQLDCYAWDQSSGELILDSRKLALRFGCLHLIAHQEGHKDCQLRYKEIFKELFSNIDQVF